MDDVKKIFSKIYDQYIAKIYRFIFLKVNSREIAEDLSSETFLRAWESFQNKKIDNPQAFLYRIARNLVIDHYREKGRVQIVSAQDASIVDPKDNLEIRAAIMSEIDNVKDALVELNDDYQNAIVWRYIDDLSISEIANLLDRTEEATRVLLHRAMEALRARLTPNEI